MHAQRWLFGQDAAFDYTTDQAPPKYWKAMAVVRAVGVRSRCFVQVHATPTAVMADVGRAVRVPWLTAVACSERPFVAFCRRELSRVGGRCAFAHTVSETDQTHCGRRC
ncbi:hypothetical protein AQ611_07725 [Burkholderia singularis]|nr:hypothetical protein AQ611_07725 [Burkholderia sp. Bp7605]